jgi:hypothetical protein
MVATHNESSVKLAYNIMKERGIDPSHNHVHFGQLYGMCDQLSYAAAAQGIPLIFFDFQFFRFFYRNQFFNFLLFFVQFCAFFAKNHNKNIISFVRKNVQC